MESLWSGGTEGGVRILTHAPHVSLTRHRTRWRWHVEQKTIKNACQRSWPLDHSEPTAHSIGGCVCVFARTGEWERQETISAYKTHIKSLFSKHQTSYLVINQQHCITFWEIIGYALQIQRVVIMLFPSNMRSRLQIFWCTWVRHTTLQFSR